MIRPLQQNDYSQVYEIWEKFYKQDFEFPDFVTNFLLGFAVVDCNDSIICAGGVRTIAESIVLTNKDLSARIRRDALYQVLTASAYVCNQNGYDHLSCWIQSDEKWYKHLKAAGFVDIKGRGLSLYI